MTSSQFRFSFLAGLALAVLGGVIASTATVGFSLMALGSAIATLACFTRGTPDNTRYALALPEPTGRVHDTLSHC